MNDTIRKPPPDTATEKDFQAWVIDTAKRRGWKYAHTYRALMQDGQWRTTTSPGFPDLLLLRGPRLVAMEVKSKTGRVDPLQDQWLDAFALLPCAEAWVVDPTMAAEVMRILR